MEEKTRKKLITLVIFLIILIAIGYLVGTEINEWCEWWKVRKEYMRMGFAEDKFPYRMYTAEELAEKGLYPESLYEDVPTRIRPEETYAIFRQALINGDLDKAAECFIEEQQKEIREGLERVKKEGLLQNMLNDLPEKLEDTYTYNEGVENRNLDKTSLTSYDYVKPYDSERIAHTIGFVKNKNGDWKNVFIYYGSSEPIVVEDGASVEIKEVDYEP